MRNQAKIGVTVALLGLIVASALSCGDDDESKVCVGDESVIVELSEGTMWVYSVTDYDTIHVIRSFQDTVVILKDTTIDGQNWSVTSIEDELWANRSDGFWVWKDFDDDVSQPYLFIKYPTGLGQDYPIPVEEIHPDTMTVADLDASTSVPYGSFSATTYKLTTYQDSLLSLGYYVRGIGKVREILVPDRRHRRIGRTIELLMFATPGC